MSKLTKNAAFCLSCETEIESKYRHDFVTCPCGDISIDGGLAYLKMSFKTGARWEDRSEGSE